MQSYPRVLGRRIISRLVLALPLPHRPLFPGFYMPIYVKDPKLLAALQESRKRQAPYAGAFLLKEEPGTDPSMVTGSESEKKHITSIQGDQVILIGHRRLKITEMVSEDPLTVKVDHLKEKPYNKDDDVIKATSFEVYKRLKLTLELVKKEVEISKIQESIAKAIEEKISGEQRRYLLNEQLKAIKKELGLETDDKTALSAKFRERLEPNKEKIPANVLQEMLIWLATSCLCGLSFGREQHDRTDDENFDVLRAQKILDEDHYGLIDVKERILEFIAVGKLRGISQGKIICLSGPPGVGKTSIGRSIARALNRKFFRFSVGGLSDVAEIKGHRRTYIGAMPGKMVQCLKNVGTANPLVLIDEIDKLGRGHTGDPASALLELLDPEQNANFLDHYLDVPIDLSKVLFVCTANVVDMIPNPLLDRMEVIAIAGYITDEKMHIARDYLEKSTLEACGIKPGQIALKLVRQGELSESDVSGETKKAKAESVQSSSESVEGSSNKQNNETSVEAETVTIDQPSDQIQGPVDQPADSKVSYKLATARDWISALRLWLRWNLTPIGVVMGLAWTAMGGSTLYIETTQVEQGEGKGALQLTGQLGDVMKESAQIAHTVARAILVGKEPDNPFFANSKLHLHVPAGATPKDGPSAGCTMITSLLSLAMKKTVRRDLAMTGEVTLTGKILPIGGVKEKTIAARRSEVKTIIFPSANRRDFDELAPNVKEGLDVHFVVTIARPTLESPNASISVAVIGQLESGLVTFLRKYTSPHIMKNM
ncbi:hypothetical protein GH714_006027 [Hevea brasiliensis]|uniref:Lon protease homolog n=1 Tax=Hevea brasiliensis TaxID=3981 RepID=A0A6A6KJN8_HEVBR|nr:hypothetical protein GH714_006027 [Hevea brasiliensis]